MQRIQRNRRFFYISGTFYLYIVVLLLTLPLRWVAALGVCATIHELFHILCAKLLSIRVDSMVIAPGGAKLYTEPMTDVQELLCALAGPIGGLMPILLLRIFPEMALIATLLTIYNLIPIYPADGARVLKSFLRLFLSEPIAQRFCIVLERTLQCLILSFGVYGTVFLHLGVFPFCITLLLALRGKMEKHLANKA